MGVAESYAMELETANEVEVYNVKYERVNA